MHVMKNCRGGRSLRSTLNKVLSVGACSALLATGALLATASPASAAGAPSQIVFTVQPPAGTTTGATLPFSVSVEDNTNTVIASGTGATDSITISTSSAGCTVGGTLTQSATNGVDSFTAVTVTAAAGTPCTLTATDTTSTLTINSSAIMVYATTATKVAFTPEPPATTVAGVNLALFRVTIENAAGTVASNDPTDTIAITSSCTLAGTASVAAASNVASFTLLAVDTGPTCTLTATDVTNALTTATSTSIAVTGGTPTKVAYTTQPPATVGQSAVLPTFKVSIEDTYGNVVSSGTGATDTVTLTSSAGCTLGGTAAAAAVAGVATFSALTITTTGTCGLTATDSTRVLTTALSTSVDSQGAQAALTVTSLTGYLGSPLTLTTSGGSGTGAVTYTATVGTAAGCVVTGSVLTVTSLGTCIVTATKAASTTNLAASSLATTVTFVVPGPQPKRVIGFVTAGKTKTITISGMYFSGRPTITSHAGTTSIVTKDTGKLLTVRVTVKAGSRNGTFTFTITNANGKSGKVKYVQRA
jgi:hypothetical protein